MCKSTPESLLPFQPSYRVKLTFPKFVCVRVCLYVCPPETFFYPFDDLLVTRVQNFNLLMYRYINLTRILEW